MGDIKDGVLRAEPLETRDARQALAKLRKPRVRKLFL
jgi:hypothetical protein